MLRYNQPMKQKLNYLLVGAMALAFIVFSVIVIPKISPKADEENSTSQITSVDNKSQKDSRTPAVAGQFYPADRKELSAQIDSLLAETNLIDTQGKLRILIAPHAGIEYSGNTAAWGFKQIQGKDYSRVIIIGSSHKKSFSHAAVYSKGSWNTPLGDVAIDEAATKFLMSQKNNIISDPIPHEGEHSLEVEVLFLQRVLNDFSIVPILVSQPTGDLIEYLAHKIALLFDDETLLIVSTDLSHYPDWETANIVDGQTIDAILTGDKGVFEKTTQEIASKDYDELSTSACGYEALRVGLRVSEILEITDFTNIKYENSGDVKGERERVVGYTSIGGWSDNLPSFDLDHEAQEEALSIARETMFEYISSGSTPEVSSEHPALQVPLGAFVTLEKDHNLRGCMGTFEPDEPLFKVIQDRAIASATKDKRFSPVSQKELSELSIEISILSPRKKIDSWREIELGVHGVVIEKGNKSGTFLPQVATDGNFSLEEFLGELCSQKVGLPRNCYMDPEVTIYVYKAQIFEEPTSSPSS